VNSSVNTHLGALAIAAISLKHNRESANHAESGPEGRAFKYEVLDLVASGNASDIQSP
jgi:hypothetical protein